MPAPSFAYTIKVDQLDGDTVLPDGDLISISSSGEGPPDVVTFTLVQEEGQWWKGIVYFKSGEPNAWTEIAAGSGDELNDPEYQLKTGGISHSELAAGFLVLSKAKIFGIHSNQYLLQDATDALHAGRHYTVRWILDNL